MDSNFEDNNLNFFNNPNYNHDFPFKNYSFNFYKEFQPNYSSKDILSMDTFNSDIREFLFLGKDDNSVCDQNNSTKETKKIEIFKFEKVKKEENINILKRKLGRKRKNDISERNHNKNSEDNIIRKIKVRLFNYAIDIINDHLEESEEILKLDHKEISNLKRDDNMKMCNKTLKEIFLDIGPSEKYKKKNLKVQNRNIINQVYKGTIREAKKLKKILDLTFLDLLEIFRGNEEKINQLKAEKLIKGKRKEGYKGFIEKIINDGKKKNEEV
jgi:hypothetical protein